MKRHANFRRQTVPALAIKLMIDGLEAIGDDANDALTKVGLLGSRHAIETGALREVPRSVFARLSQECIMKFHYHSCRRDGLRPFPLGDFRLMCIAMLGCPNLRLAIEVAGAFQETVLGGKDRLALSEQTGIARLTINTHPRGREIGDLLIITSSLAAHVRLFGWLISEEIRLTDVTLSFPEVPDQWVIDELFELDARFAQSIDSVQFPAFYLDRPIVRSYGDLSSLFNLFPFDMYPLDEQAPSLQDRVRSAMHAAIMRGDAPPTMTVLAKMFGLTVSTFRRRLESENTSLSAIRMDCRLQLAEQLFLDGTLTIKDVAARLQFCDTSSFRRAFRCWKGQSPSRYRSNIFNPVENSGKMITEASKSTVRAAVRECFSR